MSAKPETTFIHSVNKHLPSTVYHMKNHNPYLGGVPDVWYSGAGADLWVEYKFIALPNVVLERYMKLFPEHGPEQLLSVLGAEYLTSAPKASLAS